MRNNRTRQILADGGIALGIIQNGLPTIEVPRMLAAAGFDWLFIDTEHGPFNTETTHQVIRACLASPITPIVRVPDFQYDLAARALDSGAEGIIFPRTESPEQIAEAVSWVKYPPRGVRGFGLGAVSNNYVDASMEEFIRHGNEQNIVIAQIESVAGLDAIEEIASVDGLDCLLLGPSDMSVSLGIPGRFEHPKFRAAFDRIVQVCNDKGLWPATHHGDPQLVIESIQRGMRMATCNTDLALLWGAVKGLSATLRGGLQ
jgi:2-keto-3-deoxy-L-rhamnonate aldolase RhmA